MKGNGYWSSILEKRLPRRKALAAGGGATLGAAFLAACGGGEDGGSGGPEPSSLVQMPVDTSKQAKRGGTLKHFISKDISSLEPHYTQSGSRDILMPTYSKFLDFKPGHLQPTSYEIEGEGMESWEFSPDGLTLTMKLRQGLGMTQQAPANGRAMNIDDISYTWKRWEAQAQTRAEWVNSLNPQAPVLNVTTPDARTAVFKLAFPTVGLLSMFASDTKTPFIMPVEAEQIDVRNTPLGSGPYYLAEYTPSVRYVLKRNPNYWDKTHPYIDTIEKPIVGEYATLLSQFRAGSIHYFEDVLRPEDALPTKRDLPQLLMYQQRPDGGTGTAFFGWKPTPADKTPFRDERLRQALSMSYDRDAFIDTFYNVSALQGEGLPVDVRWNSSALSSDIDGWWLDPRDKKFGPNVKFFQQDIAEAKKLMAAAGFANGLDVTSNWPTTGYTVAFPKIVEVLEGMGREAGFHWNVYNPNYGSEWAPKYRDARGNFEGIAYQQGGSSAVDPVERLLADYSAYPGNTFFTGFDPDGKGTFAGDPTLEAMILRARKEFDTEKRRTMVYEVQSYLGKKLYQFRGPGSASGFQLVWPVVQNFLVNQVTSVNRRFGIYEWMDETKAPLNKV